MDKLIEFSSIDELSKFLYFRDTAYKLLKKTGAFTLDKLMEHTGLDFNLCHRFRSILVETKDIQQLETIEDDEVYVNGSIKKSN